MDEQTPTPAQTPVPTGSQTPAEPVAPAAPSPPATPTVATPAPDTVPTPALDPVPVITTGPAPAAAPEPTAPAGPKKRILLVEDDDSLASVYETRLDAEGFAVQRVPNGEDALVSALNFKPDLILLDVMMPKVSGFDVLDILRNTPETAEVKIIMLTALGQDSDKERAASLGVNDYLVKSQVVIADVVDKIKQHLNVK